MAISSLQTLQDRCRELFPNDPNKPYRIDEDALYDNAFVFKMYLFPPVPPQAIIHEFIEVCDEALKAGLSATLDHGQIHGVGGYHIGLSGKTIGAQYHGIIREIANKIDQISKQYDETKSGIGRVASYKLADIVCEYAKRLIDHPNLNDLLNRRVATIFPPMASNDVESIVSELIRLHSKR